MKLPQRHIGPIGASIVAMCPKNVGLHSNPALAMCKPTFEPKGVTIVTADDNNGNKLHTTTSLSALSTKLETKLENNINNSMLNNKADDKSFL